MYNGPEEDEEQFKVHNEDDWYDINTGLDWEEEAEFLRDMVEDPYKDY